MPVFYFFNFYSLLRRRFTRLEELLDDLRHQIQQLETSMNIRLDRLDAATSRLATVLTELRAAAINGMSAEDVARFDNTIATLEAMGTDPANPIPEPAPVVEG